MRPKLLSLALTLIVASCFGQGVTLQDPGPILRGEFALVAVTGISKAELEIPGTIMVAPPESIIAQAFGEGFILVLTQKNATPGKRELKVGLNTWIRSIHDATASAVSAKAPTEIIAKLEEIKKLTETIPLKSGSCVLEVAGIPFPPPPVDPDKPPPPPPIDPLDPNQISRVTYVFEKDLTGAPPRPVSAALNRINVEHSFRVVATDFEEDTTDGEGQIPDQYKVSLKAAQDAGLPALVVIKGLDKVYKVVKDPKTEQQVMEALK